jgi:uncharacterized RDD family membrane protein YckC
MAEKRTLHIASWDDRVVAWLLDVLLVGAILSGLGQASGIFSLTVTGLSLSASFVGVGGVALLVYWTVLEGYQGQSAGKMALDIAVVNERGNPIGYLTAAIESFGKAFLLPLDVLVGALAFEDESRRLFNKLSGTIVIEAEETTPEDVEYVYSDE